MDGHRHGLDPALLWLWCRLAAVAPIGPLTWELSYATGAALKKTKKYIYIHIFFWMVETQVVSFN